MVDRPDADESEAVRAIGRAIRTLHLQAGKPSVRTIATGIGDISHTTVHETINNKRIPSWRNVERVVRYLGGDEDAFRSLWISAMQADEGTETLQEELDTEKRYRVQLSKFFGKLRIPGNPDPRSPELNKLYIEPLITRSISTENERISTVRFADQIRTTVILGDPGCGKSTLCHWLMLRYSADTNLDTPFLIRLRDFASETLPRKSVIEFIEEELEGIYQIDAPQDFINQSLSSGSALVIFDGLDEVPETLRKSISSIIELFHAKYSSCRILVTSRATAYQHAELDVGIFETYNLDNFSPRQVDEYVNKWTAFFGFAPRIQKPAAGAVESDEIRQLPSNPLLLAWTCALHGDFGSYVRTWPEMYERWVDLLLRRWDMSRAVNLNQHRHVDRYAPLALRNLAHEMVQGKIQTVLTEHALVIATTEYLRDKVDFDETTSFARDIVDFLSERTGIFAQIGTTPTGDRLYTFTQRAFLEYFAASEIVRRGNDPEGIADSVAPLIYSQPWEMVARIAMHLVDRVFQNGVERALARLAVIANQTPGNEQRQRLLAFISESREPTGPFAARTNEGQH